jgi:hypothetical protein
MKKKQSSVSMKLKASSALMLVTLIWLTMSIPFVYNAQQEISKDKIAFSHNHSSTDDESSDNPLTNTTEEKCTNSFNSLSEEYLHHHIDDDFNCSDKNISNYHHGHESTYIAFHGELLCPPPNA